MYGLSLLDNSFDSDVEYLNCVQEEYGSSSLAKGLIMGISVIAEAVGVADVLILVWFPVVISSQCVDYDRV